MNYVRFVAPLCALSFGVVACAKTPMVETAPSPSPSQGVSAAGEVVSWSGNITAVLESNSDVRQSARGNGYGTVQMTRGDNASTTRVNVIYSAAGSTDRYLNWAILPGRCGSGSVPVLPISNFPELQIGGDGRAQVNVTLPFEFPGRGDYHINIYHERQQTLDQVIACGNMRSATG
jgi:hypothetical protein